MLVGEEAREVGRYECIDVRMSMRGIVLTYNRAELMAT
jgi:hypothetical protein